MEYFEKIVINNWPTWAFIAFSAGVIYTKVHHICKTVNKISERCEARFSWCVEHFKQKDEGNSANKGGD